MNLILGAELVYVTCKMTSPPSPEDYAEAVITGLTDEIN